MRAASGTAEVQLFGNDREATQLIQLEHRERRIENIDVKPELIDANIGLDLGNSTF